MKCPKCKCEDGVLLETVGELGAYACYDCDFFIPSPTVETKRRIADESVPIPRT